MRLFLPIFLLLINSHLLGQSPSFPAAEGCGKYTSGGRGGRVIYVNNLNDSGPGSLRDALMQQGARIVVFSVDGTIELNSKLVIDNDSITIAGQSAPGDGICIKGYPLYIKANNVIIRYIRARLGDINKIEDDAMGGRDIEQLIIDHCSVSWSVDECLSVYRSKNITVQWCMITQSLSKSSHSKGAHGFGGIWGGSNASFHHNLLAHHSSRNPRFASDGYGPVDFTNNVVFNWGYKAAYGGGRGGKINFVANYYKPGPATSENINSTFYEPAEDGSTSLFISDNVMIWNDSVSRNNWLGVGTKDPVIKMDSPFELIKIKQDKPEEAYAKVLKFAGCSLNRDSYDARIIKDVASGKVSGGEIFGGGNKGIIDSQEEVGGWPLLKKGKAPEDTDKDGMPDEWEKEHGLNANSNLDGSVFSLSKYYTNVEVYLNSIITDKEPNKTILKSCTDTVVTNHYPKEKISNFSKRLEAKGRILETSEYYVWGCAPIFDKDGKVHVFYSRWPKKYGMGGWIHQSEVAHAVADQPEGPYQYVETVIAPRDGYFDATTCHNPHIKYRDGKYYLFYMGNSDKTVFTKRIGLATATSLNGPWIRSDKPILEAGKEGNWDDCCTTNPAVVFPSSGECYLYYKSWNTGNYKSEKGFIRGNRKYGLAIAKNIDSKFKKYKENPIIDFSLHGDNKQVEDANVFIENGEFKMLMRDMGYFNHDVGLIFTSKDGISWSEPEIAWFEAEAYLEEPPAPKHLKRYGRFERPQVLLKDGKPAYLFNAMQGGKYETSTGFVFKINEEQK
ncbi:family 43 glycosylhydrolase [Plebeiibacterium sediminum]|uniref:Family 43 glycosylhydrolase n=1 Tax=Plebeiibacterium sediminum TaxID=2992112 RepID=A0AAE3SEN8_9BACT|nr:family 43 glycosylhydrolase [Plebeiobacterium sediminum]MCW3786585.1 family 43 glycosylhydrolase [Plebeiobacterium sediminum]